METYYLCLPFFNQVPAPHQGTFSWPLVPLEPQRLSYAELIADSIVSTNICYYFISIMTKIKFDPWCMRFILLYTHTSSFNPVFFYLYVSSFFSDSLSRHRTHGRRWDGSVHFWSCRSHQNLQGESQLRLVLIDA